MEDERAKGDEVEIADDIVPADLVVQPVWDQQPHEKDLWFGRFRRYLLLGPGRSVQAAYEWSQAEDGRPANRYGASWTRALREWRWAERASEYDRQEYERWLRDFEEVRLSQRRRRLALIEAVLKDSFHALMKMDLGGLDRDVLVDNMGQVKGIFEMALKSERLEYGEVTSVVSGEQMTLFDLSDDLKMALERTYGEDADAGDDQGGPGPLFEGSA